MDDSIRGALAQSGIIDITTTGRLSGEPRRIEIFCHVIDGHLYISGMPRADRTRRWLTNLMADPRLTVHLKRGLTADLPATARIITDETERRVVLALVARAWNRTDVETMVAHSPLIEVTIEGLDGTP
jgi:deazaflavin-dependent oxidoreductase (nitroreductase family)